MKKFLSLCFILTVLIISSMCIYAHPSEDTALEEASFINYDDIGTFEEVLSDSDLDAFYSGIEAVKNTSEAYKIATFRARETSDEFNELKSGLPAPDGIYVASRVTKANYREIQTMFSLGSNINAAYNTSVYFMNNFNDDSGNLIIDTGILLAGGAYAVYHSGTINNNGSSWHSGSSPLNISAGDTVYINSKIQNNKIITDVYSNGVLKGTLTTPVSEGAKNINTAKVKREFNIAGNGNIDNKDTYFSWSSAQSTVTTISNQSYKVTSSNSTLQPIKFVQPSWNHSHVGKGRTSYTSGGFIYDRAWCRCNNN